MSNSSSFYKDWGFLPLLNKTLDSRPIYMQNLPSNENKFHFHYSFLDLLPLFFIFLYVFFPHIHWLHCLSRYDVAKFLSIFFIPISAYNKFIYYQFWFIFKISKRLFWELYSFLLIKIATEHAFLYIFNESILLSRLLQDSHKILSI